VKRISWLFLITVLLLSGTLVASRLSERRRSEYLAQPLENIDRQFAGWRAVSDQTLGARVLKALLPTSYLARTYQKGDRQLGLWIAFYAQQRAGEAMHSPKACLPGSGWEIWNYDSTLIPVAGRQVKVNKYSINNGGQRMLMFYWYQSRQRIIASEYLGKILLVRDALADGRTAGSIVRITVPDAAGASDEAITFASGLIPQVQACFGR
jgi:EpsI family protein